MNRVIRCFVAMAFDKEDTDLLYDKTIKPTLRNKGVKAVRIDKLPFIGDIDDQILLELKRCDFAIADLTYARPSVYFEAGVAQARVPVIFTCRKDHFNPRNDDPFGNFRVHFDLQMKNIVSCQHSQHRTFSKKLELRISNVLIPIHKKYSDDKQRLKEIEEFESHSVADRCNILVAHARQFLEAQQYVDQTLSYSELEKSLKNSDLDSYFLKSAIRNRLESLQPGWIGAKMSGRRLDCAGIHITNSLTKNVITKLIKNILSYPIADLSRAFRELRTTLYENWILCSFRKVPWDRVTEGFERFEPNLRGVGSRLDIGHFGLTSGPSRTH